MFCKSVHIFVLSCSLLLAGTTFSAEDFDTTLPLGAVQVSPLEFNELKKKAAEAETDKEKKEETSKEPVAEEAEQVDLELPIHVAAHSGGSGSSDSAILIFAIVGTVVVFAWIPYVVVLLYKGIKHPEHYRFKSMLTTQYNRFMDTGEVERSGNMSGLRYTTFIEDKKMIEDRIKQRRFYGLNVEIGSYHFSDTDEMTKQKVGYDSNYWLVGPSFIYGNMRDKDTVFFKTDLLAGTSVKSDVDLILRAELSLNYKFDFGMVTGFGFGGNYLSGQNGKGFFKYADQLSTHWLFNLGYLF